VQNKQSGGFTIINNSMAQDKNLSLEARGLMLYLLSKPKGWKVRVDDIMQNCGVGRDKAYGLLNELIRLGYVIRKKIRGLGRYVKTVYEFFGERRKPLPEYQQVELPLPEFQEKAQNTSLPEKTDAAEPLPENPHAYKRKNYITTRNDWPAVVPNVCFSEFAETSARTEAQSQPSSPPTERSEMDQRIDLMIEKGGQALSPKLKNLREKAYQALSYWLEQGCDFERDIIPAIVDRSYGQPPAKAGGWSYYDAAVSEARAMRETPMPVVVIPDTNPTVTHFDNSSKPAWKIEEERKRARADAWIANYAKEQAAKGLAA
jgi:hypothetical protein